MPCKHIFPRGVLTNTMDTVYSHWHQTGAAPARPAKTNPLESAIAFERYRLLVVSRWPDNEIKQQRIRAIQSTLERLDVERAALPFEGIS